MGRRHRSSRLHLPRLRVNDLVPWGRGGGSPKDMIRQSDASVWYTILERASLFFPGGCRPRIARRIASQLTKWLIHAVCCMCTQEKLHEIVIKTLKCQLVQDAWSSTKSKGSKHCCLKGVCPNMLPKPLGRQSSGHLLSPVRSSILLSEIITTARRSLVFSLGKLLQCCQVVPLTSGNNACAHVGIGSRELNVLQQSS